MLEDLLFFFLFNLCDFFGITTLYEQDYQDSSPQWLIHTHLCKL